MAALEIEQKFIFKMEAIVKSLAACNARYLGTKTFLDTYYDFKDKKLALHDVWLRRRQETWELKSGNNPKVDSDNLIGMKPKYYVEREGKQDISNTLDEYEFFKDHPTFDSKLQLLQPLAIVETTRTSYRINDHTKIDLDNARLIPTQDLDRTDVTNYSLCEIEVMVYDQAQLHSTHCSSAESEIDEVRSRLGLEQSSKVLSKLDRYFLEYLPDFYRNYQYRT